MAAVIVIIVIITIILLAVAIPWKLALHNTIVSWKTNRH